MHPRRPVVAGALVRLIEAVREVDEASATEQIQRDLLNHLASAEAEYGKAEKARRNRHETLDWDVEFWRRSAVQFRAVGDAVAWKFFGYRRKWLYFLGRNPSPGHVTSKAGIEEEFAQFNAAWATGHPAMLSGLTNCLTIGDLFVVEDDSATLTVHEVKTGGRKPTKVQRERMERVVYQLMTDPRIDGGEHPVYIQESPVDLASYWSEAQPAIDRAHATGVACWSPRPGLAIRFTSMFGAVHNREKFGEVEAAEIASMRGVIGEEDHRIVVNMSATPYRAARTVPIPLLPVGADDAAQMLLGLLQVKIEVSVDSVVEALNGFGLDASVALEPGQSLAGGVPLVRWQRGSSRGSVNSHAIEALALELVPVERAIEAMVRQPRLARERIIGSYLCLANEGAVWL